MRIIDESVLDRFRGPGRCDWCGKTVRSRDAAHIFSRGAGQVDHPWNITSLCTVFSGGDNCHAMSHAGHEPTRHDLMACVAAREGILQAHIEAFVWLVRSLPKWSTVNVRALEKEAANGAGTADVADNDREQQGQGNVNDVPRPRARTGTGSRADYLPSEGGRF